MTARYRQETLGVDAAPEPPGGAGRCTVNTHTALPAFGGSVDDLLPPPVVDRTMSIGDSAQDPPLPRDPRLVVLAGGHETDVLALHPDRPFVIGREESCDLPLEDDGVSRKHAQLTMGPEGVVLEDLGSRNGTFVGNQQIQRHVLAPDEIIRVGVQTVVKFALMDAIEEEYQRRLLQAALRDGLTGLFNRRHFDERLAAESAASRRHNRSLSLAVFDIDNFKQLNDTHGHAVGDEAIRQVAQVLSANARKEDTVFRYGGEEFCLLLRETDLEGAMKATERRRELISRLRVKAGLKEIRLTVSAGVAAWQPHQDDYKLLERADRALYEAKNLGKNCVRASS